MPWSLVGVTINENKVSGRGDRHPIITIPLWEGAPASDGYKWTSDLLDNLLDDLRELVDLIMVC